MRTCHFCDVLDMHAVQDEVHVLEHCPGLDDARREFWRRLEGYLDDDKATQGVMSLFSELCLMDLRSRRHAWYSLAKFADQIRKFVC